MKNRFSNQRGSTLIVSLMILIVMTLIGLTGVMTSTLEEKMAGNTRDQALAFQAAEAALRDGEEYFNDQIDSPAVSFNGATPGLYANGDAPNPLDEATWDDARVYSGDIEGVKSQPRYIIEVAGTVGSATEDLNIGSYGDASGLGNVMAVRVTARGIGGSGNSSVILQSNYGKRF